jgi:O-antigen ligase
MSPLSTSFAARFDHPGGSPATLLSCGLAILVPLLLGVYWFIYSVDTDLAIRVLRPAIIAASLLLALIWTRPSLTWAELRLGRVMGMMCIVLIAPSLASTQPSRALADWLKMAILCGVALLLCRGLRDSATAEAFGRSLIAGAVLAGLLTVYIYVRFMGLTLPTYASARVLKSIALHAAVPLNAVAFSCVFAYICGMCLVRGTRALLWLGLVLFSISSVLTGSRAPLAILVASGSALLIVNGLVTKRPVRRLMTWLAIMGLLAAIIWGSRVITFKQMSDATEGRWDFWSVAWQKFTERPLMGYGFDSWRDDLVSRLPGEYRLTSYDAINIAGGYHNEYLTLLAEQGLVGLFPVMALFIFLLRCSWKLAFARSATWRNGQWALFGCLFLLLRGAIEAPGLFGYGQEPADYLAFIFLAIVVSRFSVEEDYVKSVQAIAEYRRRCGIPTQAFA